MKKTNTAAKYYKVGMISSVIGLAFAVLIITPAILSSPKEINGFLLSLSMAFLVFIPLISYYSVRYIYYKKITLTHIQTVKLEKTNTDYFLQLIGFEIVVTIDGTSYTAITKHLFGIRSLYYNRLDDFIGRNAEVGLDEKKQEWIIIGLAEDQTNITE